MKDTKARSIVTKSFCDRVMRQKDWTISQKRAMVEERLEGIRNPYWERRTKACGAKNTKRSRSNIKR